MSKTTGNRFRSLTHKLGGKANIKDPAALAAFIGRQKYGKVKSQAGRNRNRNPNPNRSK